MKILLKGGRIIDPETKRNEKADILIESGKIKKIGKNLKTSAKNINLKGNVVTPGFIDLHTHLREPGGTAKETIASGTLAAAKGGWTTVCAMPNTNPPIDSVSDVKYILTTSRHEARVQVLPIGAITKERAGKELTEIGKMAQVGIVAVSDDGTSIMNALVMRRAMEYTKMFDIPIISHCEDLNLSNGGMMNEGIVSTKMGLRGIPKQAEEIMISRDISLAELSGCRLHIAHISTERSISLIQDAKKRKINVTAEVTPHHLTLTDTDVYDYNTNCKVNPPLRTEKDRLALIKGLKTGIIDCIATDHAPHLEQDKNQEFDLAPFGINGLETAIASIITFIVEKKLLPLETLIEKITLNPAKILKNDTIGRLKEGLPANITVIDLKKEKIITNNFFLSKSKNSPYIGKKLKGFPVLTLYQGKTIWRDEEIYS